MSRNFSITLSSLLLNIAFIGVPLAWLNPLEINPDPYFHIQLANYYLYSGNTDARDALTVGPLIPAIYAAIKWLGLHFVVWKTQYEIYLIKGMTFACYVVIATVMTMLNVKKISAFKAIIFTAIFLAFIQVSMDALSPNGELVAVALLAILMLLLQVSHLSIHRIFFISLLSVLIIYTKIQAIPILALLLAANLKSIRSAKYLALMLIPLILGVEFFLYVKGAGIVYNLTTLFKYVSDGTLAGSSAPMGKFELLASLQGRARHILWICNQAILNFPEVMFIVLCFVFSSWKDKDIFKDWRIWLIVTLFTMVLPGRQFEHYTLFAIPFILLFSADAIQIVTSGRASLCDGNRVKGAIISFVIFGILFFYKSLIAFPDRAYFDRNNAIIYGVLPNRPALSQVKQIINDNPGSLFIHGWDYSVNIYMDAYSNRFEIPMLMARAISEKDYINAIEANQYKYILDITQYQGLIKGPEYWLNGKSHLASELNNHYKLIYSSNGKSPAPSDSSSQLEILRLYERK